MSDNDRTAISRVTSVIRGGAKGRSRLYRWLWEYYEELERARLDAGSRMDWVGIADELNKIGLQTRGGDQLTPETVRRTWARVNRDARAAGRTAAPPRADKSVPLTIPASKSRIGSDATRFVFPQAKHDESDDKSYSFNTAKPRTLG